MFAVFAGDSITDAGKTAGIGGDIGEGYVRDIGQLTADRGLEIRNEGISGNRVRDLRARWDSVIAAPPDVLTVLVGINDTWRRFDSDDPTSAEDFERDYVDIVGRARSAGVATIVLMEPFVVAVNAEQHTWRSVDLAAKIAVTRAVAERFGAHLVPLDECLAAAAREYGAEQIAADGVHPTSLGHRVIADEWLAVAGSALAPR